MLRGGEEVELEIVNLIRERVKEWREGNRSGSVAYDGASPVTKELLELWRSNDRIHPVRAAVSQRDGT
jgi:type III restriction enzyme